MTKWWYDMLTLQQILFVVACATTLFMIVQIILMLVGADSEGFDSADGEFVGGGDFDADSFDGGSDLAQSDFGAFGMRLLGMRSISAFLCIFSWVSYTMLYSLDWWWALLIGVGAGVCASLLVTGLITLVEKTQIDGTTNIRRAVGNNAEVYLRIPAARSGTGKINVIVQERLVEINAVTDEKADIPTGTTVMIESVVSDGLVVVKCPEKNKKRA